MEKKPSIKDWLLVIRPWSFSLSALPTFVAMMYVIHTHEQYNWVLGVMAIIGAVIFHTSGNLLSDYNDYKSGADQLGKQGGTDTLTSGLFKPNQILFLALSLLVVGVILGLYLVWQSGLGLLWIGIVGTIGAVFYSFFKFRAMGDLLIFLVYGPIIMLGTGYVMLGYIDWSLFFVSFPMAIITANVLHSNNTRDQRSDHNAKVSTYAIKIGTKASIVHYYLLTVLSYLSVVVMVLIGMLPIITLATLLTIPLAYKNCKTMKKATDEDMSSINDLDLHTAKLQTGFSLLMSLALVVSNII